ncbi:protein ASPARTIC PROTEASE IN GUARD CELL 1 [Prunus yedoensis var. nudiflora]|uniref:Protein ASPARTIC PROTEASE IN GUARD CELL 1 n=1 Tax=Prunus yedoensis var. nudiflora TaxID=2094558 RepID=A0A314XHN9_PRUYE|nr:protein ASPARTIC PROTEASE IN GUARD CELL 1 [Prunus yedoensis var. nudiflora]
MTRDLPSASGFALFDTCYDLSSRSRVQVPTVSFLFGDGKSLSLPAKNYLIPVDSAGTFCFAFAPTSSSPSIIGNVQQQGTRVSYDLANNRVGFSQINVKFVK